MEGMVPPSSNNKYRPFIDMGLIIGIVKIVIPIAIEAGKILIPIIIDAIKKRQDENGEVKFK